MVGVSGTSSSGIGSLGARAGDCNSMAMGPGACAENYALAMGPNVHAPECSIMIGNEDICCLRIGCYNFNELYSCIITMGTCITTLNTCLSSVAACASGATSCAATALSCANNAMSCAQNAITCAQNAASSANGSFNQLCCCRLYGSVGCAANLTASGRCLIWHPETSAK